MKRILFMLPMLAACGPAPKHDSEWQSESVADFELRKLNVPKGKHVLLAVADKPINCSLYREGEQIKEMHHEGNVCGASFESKDRDEVLVFVISYDLKGDKTVSFKYHATLI